MNIEHLELPFRCVKIYNKRGRWMLLLMIIANLWGLPQIDYDRDRLIQPITDFYSREAKVQEAFKRFRLERPELHPQVLKLSKNHIRGEKEPVVIRVLALRMEFMEEIPDDPNSTGNGLFRITDNGEDPIIGLDCNGMPYYNPYYDPPHDWNYFNNQMRSLASYVYAATYGKVRLEWVVKPDSGLPAYKVPHTIAYYGNPSNMELGLVTFMRDAFRSADLDPTISFEDLDNNGIKDYMEGVWDRYIVFYAGSAWQTDVLLDSPYDLAAVTIPPGALEYYIGREYLLLNEARDTVYDASLLPATMSQDGLEIKLQGTLFHESGHKLFLLPDLYDTYGRGAGIGAFGIMTTGPYLEAQGIPSGLIPPLPNAWERIFIDYILRLVFGDGFLNNQIITEVNPGPLFQEFKIYPLTIPVDSFVMNKTHAGIHYVSANFLEDPYSKTRMVKIPINSSEYFLLQNIAMNLTVNDFESCGDTIQVSGRWSNGVVIDFKGENDYLLPGDGLMVLHIDENIIWDNFAYNTINAVRPMGVYVLEADHVQDFQRFNGDFFPYAYCWFGSPYDLYFEANNNTISSTSNPPSTDNYGNKTRITIFDVSSQGYEMSFKVKLENNLQPFPIRVGFSVIDSNSNRMVYDEPTDGYLEVKDSLLCTLQNICRKSIDCISVDTTEVDSFALLTILNRHGLSLLSDTLRNQKFIDVPAIYDIDNNGFPELALGCSNRNLRLYTLKDSNGDGSPDLLFNIQLPEEIASAPSIFPLGNATYIGIGTFDNYYNIIDTLGNIRFRVDMGAPAYNIPASNGSLLFYQSSDGRMFVVTERFEVYNYGTPDLTPSLLSPAMVFDTTSYGLKVITATGIGDHLIYSEGGNVLKQRKFAPAPINGMAVGDIDGDEHLDNIYIASSYLIGTNEELSLLNRFPIKMDTLKHFQPLLADVDNDGLEEIIVPSENSINVYGHMQMDSLNYYPVSKGLNSHAIIEDLDGNGTVELIYLTSDGYIYAQELPTARSSWRHFGKNCSHNPYFIEIPPTSTPNEEDISLLYVYPSPVFTSSCNLRFKAKSGGHAQIEIYNFSGQKVKTIEFDFNGGVVEEKKIFTGDLGPDIYYLRAVFNMSGKKIQKSTRFIIGKNMEH